MTLSSPSSRSLELHIKYFKNGDRYNNAVNRSRVGSRPRAIDWHRDLWPWMTLNSSSSRSLTLNVKYFNKSLANAETVQLQCAVPTSKKFTVQLSAWSAKRAHCCYFAISHGWDVISGNLSNSAFFEGGLVTLRLNFRLNGYYSRQYLWTVR